MKKTLVWLTAMLVAAGAASQQRVDERIPASPDGLVEISNVSGSVRVEGWERAEVRITGILGQGAERLEIDSRPGRTAVRVVAPRDGSPRVGADIVARVPSGSRLEVTGVAAGVDVAGVAGPVGVETVSGGIRVGGTPQSVDVRSVSGAVDLEVFADTVQVRTVSGRIRVDSKGVERATLATTSGLIEFSGALALRGRLEAKSVNGAVDLTLPADLSAELSVKTFSGVIRHNLREAQETSPPRGPGRELAATMGQGSARITVNTLSGRIQVRTR